MQHFNFIANVDFQCSVGLQRVNVGALRIFQVALKLTKALVELLQVTLKFDLSVLLGIQYQRR